MLPQLEALPPGTGELVAAKATGMATGPQLALG